MESGGIAKFTERKQKEDKKSKDPDQEGGKGGIKRVLLDIDQESLSAKVPPRKSLAITRGLRERQILGL